MNDRNITTEVSNPAVLQKQPLVSVYMLAYRHERFIAEAIEGVIAQRCDFPVELIIGEDCSPDGTRAIAINYQRRYPHLIRVLTSDSNVGARANAARCLDATRGRYVAICEGDDYWHHPHKLQMQVNLMSANPDMVFCHTDFDRQTRLRTWRSKHKNHPTPWLAQGDAYLALLHEWSVMTATSMFRRDIMVAFRTTEYNNPNWPFGDYNRLLYASLKGAVGYIGVSTATYRKVRGSAGNQSNSAHLRVKLANQECVEMFLNRHPVDKIDERVIQARLKMETYRAAFYAERIDLLLSSYGWLQSNGFLHSLTLHRLRIFAVRLGFPVRTLQAIKNFIDLYLSSVPA